MRKKILIILIIYLIFSCNENGWKTMENKDNYEKNFDTPQGAVLCLEDAYRSKDIERILSCKDFSLEAIYMLKYEMENTDDDLMADEEIIDKLAETLELAFISEMKVSIPNFDGVVKSEFPRMKVIDEKFVILEEVCTYNDGGQSKQKLIVGKNDSGWRIMTPK